MKRAALATQPAPPSQGQWSIHFADERDFCRFASILIGAVYQNPMDALERFERESLWGEKTFGKVGASAPTQPPAEGGA